MSWRQANAVSVFGIRFIRKIVAALADDGISPAHPWLTQEERTTGAGGRKGLFDSTGTANGAYLISAVAVPRHRVHLGQVIERVLADADYPVIDIVPREPRKLRVGPYGFRIGTQATEPGRATKHEPDIEYLTVTSPTYYCRYDTTEWPGTVGSRRWPLDPTAEREPIIDTEKPRQRTPTREEIPAATQHALTVVQDWGQFLGYEIGPTTAAHW